MLSLLRCSCGRSYTEHTWNTVVQLRQKVRHKRTFYWLEQLLLKHNVCEKTLNVKEQPEGLDFYWGHKNQAVHMLVRDSIVHLVSGLPFSWGFCGIASVQNFLQAVVPIRFHTAKRLISEDIQSNVKNYKFTYAVEVLQLLFRSLLLATGRHLSTVIVAGSWCPSARMIWSSFRPSSPRPAEAALRFWCASKSQPVCIWSTP